eukprot:scaffold316094_cov22-Tisochrysis_lutea.AAC.1
MHQSSALGEKKGRGGCISKGIANPARDSCTYIGAPDVTGEYPIKMSASSSSRHRAVPREQQCSLS